MIIIFKQKKTLMDKRPYPKSIRTPTFLQHTPPSGRSDGNLVHLKPMYEPLVQQPSVTTRTVRRWTQEADESLF